jgi:predicted nucleic acid-binding Zn ribbon protein
VKEKNIRYARAGYQAKKPAAVTPTAKKAAATVGKEKACAACGKMFTPWRKDQKCCSTTCGKSTKAGAARKQTVKPPADPEAAAADAATSASIFPADCAVCGLGFNPRYEGQKTCCTSCAKELGQRNGGQA